MARNALIRSNYQCHLVQVQVARVARRRRSHIPIIITCSTLTQLSQLQVFPDRPPLISRLTFRPKARLPQLLLVVTWLFPLLNLLFMRPTSTCASPLPQNIISLFQTIPQRHRHRPPRPAHTLTQIRSETALRPHLVLLKARFMLNSSRLVA
jgi:hypothetical protein